MSIDADIDLQTYSTSQNGMVSSFWLWLKLCVSWVWPIEYVYEIEYEYDENYDSLHRYTVNRQRRRFTGKNLARERDVSFYHAIFPSHLTRGQFIERSARLSVEGRRKFYGTMSHSPRRKTKRLQFLPLGSSFSAPSSVNAGLWEAHLWPS